MYKMQPATDCHRILIVGDSRIRDLETLLNNTSLNLAFTVECLPGARIERIGLKIMSCLAYTNTYELILFIGGINDVTKVRFNPTRHATLRYQSSQEICDSIMSQLYLTRDKLAKIIDIPIYIATIPGMNLINYSPAVWYRLLPLQEPLDTAMFEINRRIRGLNRWYGLRTLNLAYPIHRCAGHEGRYYSHYGWLWDGLHPGLPLKERWARNIIDFCTENLPSVSHIQGSVKDYW